VKDFGDLRVWERAHKLTLEIYRHQKLSARGTLWVAGQACRCSAPIAANIAESCGRRGNGKFYRFLQIASGSASELDYHFLLARDLGLLGNEPNVALYKRLAELPRMLTSLIP